MPTLPLPNENKQLTTRKKFTFASPLLVGLLVLFVGLGTYAILRSRAAVVPTPANGDTWRIHIIGDSISDGCDYYRSSFVNKMKASGIKFDMVGTRAGSNHGTEPCASVSDDENDAHGGWCTSDAGNICQSYWDGAQGILENVDSYVTPTKADIVMLWIGTNDACCMQNGGDKTPAGVAGRVGQIVDKILAIKPDTAVIVGGLKDSSYNAAYEAMVKERFDADKRVYYINPQDGTNGSDWDTVVHPIGANSPIVAENWFQAIKKYTTGELPQPDGFNNTGPTPTSSPTGAPTTRPTPLTGVTPGPQPAPATTALRRVLPRPSHLTRRAVPPFRGRRPTPTCRHPGPPPCN